VTDAMLSVDPTLTPRVEVASSEPPLVIMHNFIPPGDCYAILEATRRQEMHRSTMGATQEESHGRTSSTAWLAESLCEGPLRRIAEKTSRISQLPPSHMENLQVVKYQPGQEFILHTDHLDSFNDLECRGRLATCLLYLDSPTKGGETSFPEFNAVVPPTKGSAVFFWNTLERPGMKGYDPNMFLHVDAKLRHAGLPVLEGEKWVCNRWIHPIDYGAGVRGISASQTV
jgi:prolyl 4-hydroxylase